MSKRPVIVLLLGPTGSGKSNFVKHATGQQVDVGLAGGARPCTTECKTYDLTLDGIPFTIIDTPGFEDSPPGSLTPLSKIAEMLHRMRPREVTAAIYFHRITDGRLTGSARFNLEIFKQLCGESFYPRVAFVTTMWDVVGLRGLQRYNTLNSELQEKYFRLADRGPDSFKLNNDPKSCEKVLRYLGTLPDASQLSRLLFSEQLARSRSTNVRKTSAGKEALKKSGRGGACTIL